MSRENSPALSKYEEGLNIEGDARLLIEKNQENKDSVYKDKRAPVPFNSPSCMIISGQSGAGKTHFCKRILTQASAMYSENVTKILYCYRVFQPLYEDMEKTISNITFHKGVPSEDMVMEFTNDVSSDGKRYHTLLVADDLQDACVNNPEVARLFCVYSHHRNCSVIVLFQNMFQSGSQARAITLQAHYLVLLKSLRDMGQLSYLSRQIYPKRSGLLTEVFNDIIQNYKHPYLVDTSAYGDERLRLRTCIFPGEEPIIYVPR